MLNCREDTKTMKSMLGGLSMQVKHLQVSMNAANNTLRSHSKELLRLDVLLEDLNDRFGAARELRWD